MQEVILSSSVKTEYRVHSAPYRMAIWDPFPWDKAARA